MATIRVRDWTKRRIEEIAEAESHSSHDSVIKSLLKDRELAAFAGVPTGAVEAPDESTPTETAVPEGAIPGMCALAELHDPENGLFFCWCPNCGNEVAHLSMETPLAIDVFELECGRCLTQLDQHAIVAIELSYPLEEQLVADSLEGDLRTCVVDYWDRALAGDAGVDADPVDLVDRFAAYARAFGWTWPTDVPVVALEVGRVYRDTETGEFLRVVEPAGDDRTGVGEYVVRRLPAEAEVAAAVDGAVAHGSAVGANGEGVEGDGADGEGVEGEGGVADGRRDDGTGPFADVEPERLGADRVADLVRARRLVLVGSGTDP